MAVDRGIASPARKRPEARQQVLQQVLQQGGAKSVALLRRWAKEGRAYRSLVFTVEEVEAALKATGLVPDEAAPAQAAPTAEEALPQPGEGVMVLLKNQSWPPDELLEAAVRVAGQLGPLSEDVIKPHVRGALLRSLYEGSAKRARHPDLILAVGQPPVKIGAHKEILSSLSDFMRCKFSGAFSDGLQSSSNVLDQSSQVVKAVVEFLYTGSCQVEVGMLSEVVVLADFWQIPSLQKAAEQSWYRLPIVHQMEILANLDEDSRVPAAMVGALVASLAKHFNQIADIMKERNMVAASFEVTAQKMPLVEVCWRFVQELHDWLTQTPDDALQRLKMWVGLEEDDLHGAVQRFFLETLKAACAMEYNPGFQPLPLLRKRRMKAWLPDNLVMKIVDELYGLEPTEEEDGQPKECLLGDASGQVPLWLTWTYSGGPNISSVYDMYLRLRSLEQARRINTAEGAPIEVSLVILPAFLELEFGTCLAEETYADPEAGAFWERLWRADCAHSSSALEQAIQLIGSSVLRGRHMPAKLPVPMAAEVLEAATAKATVGALRINGRSAETEVIAGVYTKQRDGFKREQGKPLKLRRVVREKGDTKLGSMDIVWKGLPPEYKQARAMWKIEHFEADEFDAPLAVLLTTSTDPCGGRVPWWICHADGRFRPDPALKVQIESVTDDETKRLRRTLDAWAAAGNSLRGLEVAQASPVAAGLVKAAAEASEAEEARRAEEAAAAAKPENDPKWLEAAELVDEVAGRLCELLQELRGAKDAETKRRLLQRKRRIEEAPDFLVAVRRLSCDD